MCMHQVRRKVMIQKTRFKRNEQGFDHFPQYHMTVLLGDFNVKGGERGILKPTIGNESLHQDSIDNGVKIVNCAT